MVVMLKVLRYLCIFMTPEQVKEPSVAYYHDPPSYQQFLAEHLLKNEPALIGPSLTAAWKARKEWILPVEGRWADGPPSDGPDPTTQPNFELLAQEFGNAEVQVADCLQRDFTDQKRGDMTFEKFIDIWQSNDPQFAGRYYLKDWHFVKAFPEYKAYHVPDIFEGIMSVFTCLTTMESDIATYRRLDE